LYLSLALFFSLALCSASNSPVPHIRDKSSSGRHRDFNAEYRASEKNKAVVKVTKIHCAYNAYPTKAFPSRNDWYKH
jgi:hypothetical protein